MRIEGGTVTVVEEAPLTAEEAELLLLALRSTHWFEANKPEPTDELLAVMGRLERIVYPPQWVIAEPGVVPRIVTEP